MKLCACLFASAIAMSVNAPAYAAAALVPHRAIYDISLEESSHRAGITNIAGRMVYEFNGSSCEGYTVNFRFVTQVDSEEVSRLTDQQTTTWEDGAGESFAFSTRTFIDSLLDNELRGTATAEAEETVVELVKPEKARHELARTLFPTQHMVDLLERIERGDRFYETTIFDGSDEADEVLTTAVVIGKQAASSASDPEETAIREMKDSSYWPVSVAYFEEPEERGESLPIYRIAFKLHANGVTRSIIMDYGDFSMRGSLVDLELFDPPADCAR